MKHLLTLLTALGLLATARANDVLVYKFSSPRAWTQYQATNPDLLTGGTPRTTLAGTLSVTEYWVLDQTTLRVQTLRYFVTYVRGVATKHFAIDPVVDLNTLGIRKPRWIATNLANTFTLCLADGTTDATSSFEKLLTGTARPYTVATGIVIPKVATVLTGEFVGSEKEEVLNATPAVTDRRLLFESGAQSLVIDAGFTRLVHTTGTLPERATLDFGTRLLRSYFERLGYDLVNP